MKLDDLTIYPTNWGKVAMFESYARKEGVQMKADNGKTSYLGIYNLHHLIGFVGWMIIGNKIRYKADFVFINFRGKGVYSKLWEKRDEVVLEIMRNNGYKEITAYCTSKSLPMYIKNGFKKVSVSDTGITFVVKKI